MSVVNLLPPARTASVALLLSALLAACSTSKTHTGGQVDLAVAEGSPVAKDGMVHCTRKQGTLAITESDNNAQALSSAGLPRSMAPLVRYMLSRSGCFTVVDRGAAFALMEQERKVRAERGIATPSRTQPLTTIDYVMRAEIVFAEQTGGSKGLLGGVFGNVIAGVGGQYVQKEAVVLLSVVDADTSEIVSSTFGRGSSDSSGLGNLALAGGAVLIDGGWADTPQAKTVAAALLDAWNRTQPKLSSFIAAQEAAEKAAAEKLAAEKAAAEKAAAERAAAERAAAEKVAAEKAAAEKAAAERAAAERPGGAASAP